jgi:hypothetical protein
MWAYNAHQNLKPLQARAPSCAPCEAGSESLVPQAGYIAPHVMSTRQLRQLLRKAQDAIVSLADADRLVRTSGPCVSAFQGSRPDVARVAAQFLRELRRHRLGGTRSAVLMLGKEGIAVADWNLARIYHVGLFWADLNGEDAKSFELECQFSRLYRQLAESWAFQAPLKDPVLDAAKRAVYAIAASLHLPAGSFEIEVTRL